MAVRLILLGLPLVTAACALTLPFGGGDDPRDAPVIAVVEAPGADVIRPRPRTADTPILPQETPASTVPAPQADGFVGETLAGLGAPGEAGNWLVTGLVERTRPGRVVTESGQSVSLELRPSGAQPGAGSQISLAAMQTLGLNLAQLATLRVYVD
jgi:hypothetical protein